MLFQLGMNKLENKLCDYKFRVSKLLTIEHFILHCLLSFEFVGQSEVHKKQTKSVKKLWLPDINKIQ